MDRKRISPTPSSHSNYAIISSSSVGNINLRTAIENNRLRFMILKRLVPLSTSLMGIALVFTSPFVASLVISVTILLITAVNFTYFLGHSLYSLENVRNHSRPLLYVSLLYLGLGALIFLKRPSNTPDELILRLVLYSILSVFVGVIAYTLPLNIQIRRVQLERVYALAYITQKRKNTTGTPSPTGLTVNVELDSIFAILIGYVSQPILLIIGLLVVFLGPTLASIVLLLKALL